MQLGVIAPSHAPGTSSAVMQEPTEGWFALLARQLAAMLHKQLRTDALQLAGSNAAFVVVVAAAQAQRHGVSGELLAGSTDGCCAKRCTCHAVLIMWLMLCHCLRRHRVQHHHCFLQLCQHVYLALNKHRLRACAANTCLRHVCTG